MGLRAAGLVVLVVLAGCPHPAPHPRPQPSHGTVRVRAITDPTPVRILAPADDYLFAVGPHGIDRWDPKGGTDLPLSEGLPGDRVLAVAFDVEREWLWIATDGGLGYYDVKAGTVSEVAAS